jgi:predicted nucleic acid-binding protein
VRAIGNNDTLIAAHVLSLEATLVTNNVKHFGKTWLGNSELGGF